MSEPELDRLRQLLLRPEQQRLDALEGRNLSAAERAGEIADLLPAAVRQAADDGRLAPALAGPLKDGLRETIRKDATGLAEVLFPVMGPSIRRAIAESLRDFVNSMNGAVAQAVSWQGLRWRMEAARTGRSYGEVVLSHTLSYRVEQALLIHRESGLVISKAELSSVVANDSDAFSAMLSAIQDFVSDSLHGDSALSTIDMGERTIWIVRGPHAHLACIISGVAQKDLREHLANVLDAAHNHYGELLADFVGDPAPLAGIDEYTARCLQVAQATAPTRPARWPALVLLALIVIAVGAWLLRPGAATADLRIYRALENQPGIVVQNIHRDDDVWAVTLLRDPLAADPAELLRHASLSEIDLRLDIHPFQSLDPRLVLERAQQQLRIPGSVQARLVDTTLTLEGHAESAWIRGAERGPWPAGITALDTSGLARLQTLADLQAALPAGVQAEVIDETLVLSGNAPFAWIQQLETWLQRYQVPPLGDSSRLVAQEQAELERLATAINSQHIYFREMLELGTGQSLALRQLAATLREVATLSKRLGVQPTLTLTAHSDGLGSAERNRELRQLRADRVRALLTTPDTQGILLETQLSPDYPPTGTADLSLRRVDLALSFDPEPATRP